MERLRSYGTIRIIGIAVTIGIPRMADMQRGPSEASQPLPMILTAAATAAAIRYHARQRHNRQAPTRPPFVNPARIGKFAKFGRLVSNRLIGNSDTTLTTHFIVPFGKSVSTETIGQAATGRITMIFAFSEFSANAAHRDKVRIGRTSLFGIVRINVSPI